MTLPDVDTAPIPDDETPEPPQTSGDPVCRVCGTALVYAGRGRKPVLCDAHKKQGNAAARSNVGRNGGEVDSALVILGGMYDGLSAGLMLVSPQAASMWVTRIDGLQASNRTILTADKDLCRRINNLARGGGKFAFVAAHAMALAPVAAIVRLDLVAKAEAKAAAAAAAAPADFVGSPNGRVTVPDGVPPWLQ